MVFYTCVKNLFIDPRALIQFKKSHETLTNHTHVFCVVFLLSFCCLFNLCPFVFKNCAGVCISFLPCWHNSIRCDSHDIVVFPRWNAASVRTKLLYFVMIITIAFAKALSSTLSLTPVHQDGLKSSIQARGLTNYFSSPSYMVVFTYLEEMKVRLMEL